MKYAKRYMAKIGSAGILLTALAATACMDHGDDIPLIELGAVENSFTVNATAGHVDIQVYSNQPAVLSFLDDGASWADLSDTRLPLDGKFYIDYADNAGFPRMTRVLIQSADAVRSDTVVLRQRGARIPAMAFEGGTSTNVPGSSGGKASVRFGTNIAPDELTFTTQYDAGEEPAEEWLSEIALQPAGEEEYTFNFDYAGNDTDELRTATVTVSYVNGWEETEQLTLNVIQRTKNDMLGHDISFAELREKALTVSKVDEYWLLEGYVVSDRDSKNAGNNPMPTDMSVDYSGCEKTVYLESPDGRYGFCVETATPEDNAFTRYDKVKILLKDAELVFEPDPDRYMIKGIRSSMIVERVTGNDASVLPVKQKYISELTDEDIYTFVTLRDCEFAVRKGSLTPVHEGYTLADAQGRLNMYPRLVRDNRGGLIHLLTNTTCPYRRNGTRLPYGSGELAGVIVHERFPQYEYVDTADDLANGIIGSYQIRHMSFADIRFAEDRSQSFSETLTEYSYVKGKAAAADGYAYWYPTWGTNGRFTQTASKSAYPNGVYNAACWHYLGWCGTARGTAPFRSHIGNDGYSGFGVILEDGTNYAVKSTAVNTDGKGTDQANWLAWVTTYWWNASTDRPYAWVVEFSTAGLSSDRVSLIMSVQSGRATLNAGPYFWKVQWSATGDYESDEGWFDVEAAQTAPDGSAYTFTQPDFPVFATQRSWQLPAYKQVEIPLPAEIMGREKVWLRIQPASRLSSGLGFLDGTIPMGYNAAGAMDYLAVRYNR